MENGEYLKMEEQRCDLHIHSNFSDSDATIEDIFKEAFGKKIFCLAITDHDTVEGLEQARIYSKAYNIELIEGVELSAQHNDAEIHILGYFSDVENDQLKKELLSLRELRERRIIWMAEKLNSLGVLVDIDELFLNMRGAIPTRLHLGLYLLRKGRVSSLRQAFSKYLSPGKPAYKSRFKFSVKEAIEFIKKFGGVSILAHPHMISDQSWIAEFVSFGVDGLEIAYHNMPQAKRILYDGIIQENGLLKSGGSDAHGSYKEFTQIGAVTIPYSWVSRLKGCLETLNT